jgi:hypothetical protein
MPKGVPIEKNQPAKKLTCLHCTCIDTICLPRLPIVKHGMKNKSDPPSIVKAFPYGTHIFPFSCGTGLSNDSYIFSGPVAPV